MQLGNLYVLQDNSCGSIGGRDPIVKCMLGFVVLFFITFISIAVTLFGSLLACLS